MQYTIRNIPPELDAELRERARREGRSLNDVVLEAMARGAGLGDAPMVHRDLSDVAGMWQRDVATDRALDEQRQIDPELWK